MKIKELIKIIEDFAPLSLQESYDNSGLLIGSENADISSALITLDVTEEVLDEAINGRYGIIIAHHPLIFSGLKRLNGSNFVEKLVIKAIKNNVAIYAVHTNIDNAGNGLNAILGRKLGLNNLKILKPGANSLKKLVVFCPVDHAESVRKAMFDAGAGHIGNYDGCSYNTEGLGTFRALEGANPYVGDVGKLHFEKEIKIETIVPDNKLGSVLSAMFVNHPYEEVAYDIYPLENVNENTGAGMIGELENELDTLEFLKIVKDKLKVKALKFNKPVERKVKKIAFCGGSGAFLINDAFRLGADVFITGDVKYHDYFEHIGKMTIVDAGHYETEQFIKELLYELLTEKFPTFAVRISKINTNPVLVL